MKVIWWNWLFFKAVKLGRMKNPAICCYSLIPLDNFLCGVRAICCCRQVVVQCGTSILQAWHIFKNWNSAWKRDSVRDSRPKVKICIGTKTRVSSAERLLVITDRTAVSTVKNSRTCFCILFATSNTLIWTTSRKWHLETQMSAKPAGRHMCHEAKDAIS